MKMIIVAGGLFEYDGTTEYSKKEKLFSCHLIHSYNIIVFLKIKVLSSLCYFIGYCRGGGMRRVEG